MASFLPLFDLLRSSASSPLCFRWWRGRGGTAVRGLLVACDGCGGEGMVARSSLLLADLVGVGFGGYWRLFGRLMEVG